ncbi:Calx-beta domain-containing protein [Wenxinia marina]|uniref:Calx-beta domain-containing protein n=1 Tax=Wenxinia marina DSM 24838 TaxID=1123501 RepID=A0A0D0PJ19_9RHOB|nr:Calx-beta domain-containing protein [Wenxinia marina]KIQ71406.1 hypothetical protein Wenmar_04116 [Wenxinia marina DSM 24838]GGL78711.1 hypothetical protein GCM10011392_36520 [Wenxinia marina]
MAVVSVRNISILEGNASSSNAIFTVTLDRVATAPVQLDYFLQGGSAAESKGDFNEYSSTLTIPVGSSSGTISTQVYGDLAVEGAEFFDLYLTARQNAEFADGAAALRARATILDDDDGLPDPVPGLGDPATPIFGPVSEPGLRPTLDVQGVSLIEGSGSSDPARFLLTLDRPATAQVTGSYYFGGVTAAESKGDFDDYSSSFTIQAGQQSTWLSTNVYGDTAIEGDETFELVLTDLTNAVFRDGAAALRATGTILDDDGGAPSGPGGIGAASEGIGGPVPVSASMPTLRVHDSAVIEGNGSSDPARFLVTLDRPAPATVTFDYAFENGVATEALGDFDSVAGTARIEAGQQSLWLSTNVYGDTAIEGDEDFYLVLTGIANARFEYGAPALVATGTILDDDGGALSGPAGIGDAARGVRAPDPGPGGAVTMQVFGASISEGDGSSDEAYIHVVLSEPAPTEVTVRYQAYAGSAEDREDFYIFSGTLRIPAGDQSARVQTQIYGDTAIEGDEGFDVVFTNPTGAIFAGGGISATASVLIRDNDGGGTAGDSRTGPEFDFYADDYVFGRYIEGTDGADDLRGTPEDDIIAGLGRGDTLVGADGDDRLIGGDGRDVFAIVRSRDAGIDMIEDFEDGDILALDDRFFGRFAGNSIDPRGVTQDQARQARESGKVFFDAGSGALSIDGEVVALLGESAGLGYEDVFLF